MVSIIKYIKKLGTDFIKLEKHIFFRKYLMPPVLLFILWTFIGNISALFLELDDLQLVKGKVIKIIELINTEKGLLFDNVEKKLIIRIENYSGYFRLTDSYDYEDILSDISIGDFITIYHRNKLQTILSFGIQNDIYSLWYKGYEYFPLSSRKYNSLALVFFSFLAFIVASGFFVIWIKGGIIVYKIEDKDNRKS